MVVTTSNSREKLEEVLVIVLIAFHFCQSI